MKRWLLSINQRFDRVAEPKRMFLFFGLLLPGIIAANFTNPFVAVGGGIYLLAMFGIRLAYVSGKFNG